MVNLNLRTNVKSGQVITPGISARLCAIPLALALFGISSANAQAGGLSIISTQLGNINALQANNPGVGVGAIHTIQPTVITVVSLPIPSPQVYHISVPISSAAMIGPILPGGGPQYAIGFNNIPYEIISPGGYANSTSQHREAIMDLGRGGENNINIESAHAPQGGDSKVSNSDDQGKNSPSANSDNVAFSEIRPTGEEYAKGGSESADVEVAGGQPTGVTFLLVSGGKGAAQSADLGRNGAISGAAPDVFAVNYHVADVPQYVAGVSRSMYFCEDVFQQNTCLQAGRVAAR